MTTPTLQKNSAAEWAAFNLEIEKLNAKYLAPEVVGKAMRVGRDSGSLSKEQKVAIVLVDLVGAVEGAVQGANWGKTLGGYGAIAGGVIWGVIRGATESIALAAGFNACGCMVSMNPLTSIDDLKSDSLASVIGERHNMIVEQIISDFVDITNMSDSALLAEVTICYERLFGPISTSLKSSILSTGMNKTQEISIDIELATAQYVEMIVNLNGIQKHAYTEEYLEVIDATFTDSEEKTQMLAGIGTGYHSASLWEIEGQP